MALQPWFRYAENNVVTAKRAAVIGGGLAGTSIANALARRGWEITLIERNTALSSEASGNPSGVVMPSIDSEHSIHSQFSSIAFQFAIERFRHFQPNTQLPLFHQTGVLRLNNNVEKFRSTLSRHASALQLEILSTNQLRESHDLMSPTPALHFPTAGWADPSVLCAEHIQTQQHRIKVVYAREAIHLQQREAGWSIFTRHDELIEAPVIVIANGTEASRFAPTAPFPVTPVRGQISFIDKRAVTQPFKQVICSDRGYIIPDKHDSLSIGATYDRDSTSTKVTESSHRQNLRNIQSLKLIIGLNKDAVMGGRAAVRATTPDRLPMVGGVPDFSSYQHNYRDLHHGRKDRHYPEAEYHQGLYLMAGFGSHGITHCPYSGELLARLINGDLRDADRQVLALLHPGRFTIRQLKKHPQFRTGDTFVSNS